MKKFLEVAFWIAASLAGAFVLLVALGPWSLSRSGYAFPDGDLPRHLAGRWDCWKPWAYTAGVVRCDPDGRAVPLASVTATAHPPMGA